MVFPIDNTDPTGCAAPGADCDAKLQAVRDAIKKLGDRVNEHIAHGGTKCDKMDHEKAIQQAMNALAKALAAAGSCISEEEKKEVEEWAKNLYQNAVDILYDDLQSLWKQLTTMPTQPSFGPRGPYGPPVWTMPVNPIAF